MKIISKYFLIAFLLICACCLFSSLQGLAQNKIDSLFTVLKTAKEDTNKVKTLNELSLQLRINGEYKKAREYSNKSVSLINKFPATSKKSKRIQSLLCHAYNNIGIAYEGEGMYPEALKMYLTVLKISEMMQSKFDIASSFINIGNIYYYQENFTAALQNFTSALEIKQEINDRKGVSNSYNNIGAVYQLQGNYGEALKNHLAALKIDEESGDSTSIVSDYIGIGNVYYYQGDFIEALQFHFAALKILEKTGNKQDMAISLIGIGYIYSEMKKFSEAEEYLRKGLNLSIEMGEKERIKDSYGGFVQLDSMLGNYKSAYEHYKLYIVYRDSLINEENTKKIVQTQMQYEFDKKEAATKAEQDKKDALAGEEKRKQKIILWSVVSGLMLVIVFALFVFRAYRQKQKDNIKITKQKQIIEEKQMEILASIRYAKRIQTSMLPTEKYIAKTLKRLNP